MTLRGVRIVLASVSPRRRELLEREGAVVRVVPPPIDDSGAPFGGGDPETLVASLAWFKAAQVLDHPEVRSGEPRASWLLAADTVCVIDGRIAGKPATEAEASEMVRSMSDRRHAVFTGACLVDLGAGDRRLFVDRAEVELGPLDERAVREHLSSRRWEGRAGGYNFSEARDAGWPIRCAGDETTVMGLPMRRLAEFFAGVGRRASRSGA